MGNIDDNEIDNKNYITKQINPPPSPFPTLEICADVVQPHVLGLRVGTLAIMGQSKQHLNIN